MLLRKFVEDKPSIYVEFDKGGTEKSCLMVLEDAVSDCLGEPVTFSNVIVQFMDIEYFSNDAPLPTVTGTNNAEYFMGGKHIKGVWSRDTLQDRTVFYDMNGNEIQLQRGHTLIIMMDYSTKGREISYE